ncbi:unnamed protein product [Blepharisma stoltei]|uniref:Adenosine deaminase domain-containing protein n=1 Tax=Blepharisma stoltei TaxID=1481888 RepID=A0AAU9IMZ0_9CILI|nr:unnamed protein product [Blepharisma stoltei]
MLQEIQALPKVELHAHLNGSLRKETLIEFLAEDGKNEGFDKDLTMDEAFRLFSVVHSVVTRPDRVERITREMLEDFEKENTVYLEIRTSPKATQFMTKLEYLNSIIKAIREFQGKMVTKVLISVNRAQSVEAAWENIELAKNYPECVGVEFSGNPNIAKFRDFLEVFNHARDIGMKVSIHTAEIPDNEDTLDIIRFRPDRLGHCCYLETEAENLIIENRIPIEICPSSNMATMGLTSMIDHHFGRFYTRSHPIAICTDDTLLLNTTLSKEYYLVAETFHLTIDDLKRIIRESALMSFFDWHTSYFTQNPL